MAKRLSEKEKIKIVKSFIDGKTIDELSEEFSCTKLTISRNLKKNIGDNNYKALVNKNNLSKKGSDKEEKNMSTENKKDPNLNNNDQQNYYKKTSNKNLEEDSFPLTQFIEISPLNYEIEDATQKDLSSVPISEIEFPKIVYMIVDKKIELEIKYLKDYPDWKFLSQEDLNRTTIQIFEDLKIAKRICTKDQKVIKVPNTNVFRIVAPLLLSRGISRIVTEDKLIAL